MLVWLGVWQLERLAWKEALIERIAARRLAVPLILSTQQDIAGLRQASDEYRMATLRGRFGDEAVFWFTQIENKPPNLPRSDAVGYHVLSPFYLRDGTALLIDRGFVPARLKDIALQGGAQNLSVILRWPDARGRFDNADRPSQNLFYVRDPKAIGAFWNIALPPLLGEIASPTDAWPRGGQTRMVFTNNHLQYAGTWFGLAIVLVIISGLWHIGFYRSRKKARQTEDTAR